jgi:hypothetical protein
VSAAKTGAGHDAISGFAQDGFSCEAEAKNRVPERAFLPRGHFHVAVFPREPEVCRRERGEDSAARREKLGKPRAPLSPLLRRSKSFMLAEKIAVSHALYPLLAHSMASLRLRCLAPPARLGKRPGEPPNPWYRVWTRTILTKVRVRRFRLHLCSQAAMQSLRGQQRSPGPAF